MTEQVGVLDPGGPGYRLLIDLEAVRSAVSTAIDTATARWGQHVQVREDFYWKLTETVINEQVREPELVFASLVDDYGAIVDFVAEPAAYHDELLRHALDRFAGVLTMLSAAEVTPAAREDVVALGWADR